MSNIVLLSKYGFKLDSLKSDWVKCDKSLLKSERFAQLRKGMDIDVVEKNKQDFVLNFRINSLPCVSDDCKIDSRARDILKGQCLNIAFQNCSMNVLDFEDQRQKGIRLAHKLFDELLQSKYAEW